MKKFIEKLKQWWKSLKDQPAPGPVDPPAPVDPPPAPPVSERWLVKEIWKRSLPWKFMFIKAVPRGILLSSYDRKSRKNSELHEYIGGKVGSAIYRGGEETLGDDGLGATDYNQKTFMCAEVGKNVMIYDHATGRVSRGASLPKASKFNVFNCMWQGRPVAGAASAGSPSFVFDMLTGDPIFTSPLKGLIAGMCEDMDGILWLAVSDGEQGVASSSGHRLRGVKPASVAFFGGNLVAGSMIDGKLYSVTPKNTNEASYDILADLKCSKINRLVVDGNRLLIAGSNPDTFAIMALDGRVTQIARFDDQKPSVSGEQFDADINAGPNGSVLMARSNDSGCFAYIATQDGGGPVTPNDPPPPAREMKWLSIRPNGINYPITSKLKASISKSGVSMEFDPPLKGDVWMVIEIDRPEATYVGDIDGLSDHADKKRKSLNNITGDGKGGPLIARYGPGKDEAKNRAYLRLQDNEPFRVWGVAQKTKTRSEAVTLIFPPGIKQ